MRTRIACAALCAVFVRAAPAVAEDAPRVVEDGLVVAVEYTLKLEDGSVVDTNVGSEPLVIVQGRGEVFPGLERALAGMAVGESKHGVLAPADAYGEVDPKLFVDVELSSIPETDRHVGAQIFARDASGERRVVRVYEIHGDRAIVDMNHALAGNAIAYEIKVLRVEAPR